MLGPVGGIIELVGAGLIGDGTVPRDLADLEPEIRRALVEQIAVLVFSASRPRSVGMFGGMKTELSAYRSRICGTRLALNASTNS